MEVRIDSDRFSAHPDADPACSCELCGEEATSPILSHEHPLSLLDVPRQKVPSRGWGEEFWVRITARQDDYLRGVIDNYLYESRLHGIDQGDEIIPGSAWHGLGDDLRRTDRLEAVDVAPCG